MIYFIADTHFNDENIIKFENRPYNSIDAMNEDIIRIWNETVKPEDEVYLLGDFFCYDSHRTDNHFKAKEIVTRLNGNIYLVKGNHDISSNENYRYIGFKEVYDKPIILDGFWILSHEPMYVSDNTPYANIFGHVHDSPIYNKYSKHHYCVSLEKIYYVPVSFDEIKKAVGGE